jgi:DNA primase
MRTFNYLCSVLINHKKQFPIEIKDIKTRLAIQAVLKHYNITTNGHNKTRCPFHEENTPSFTIYPKTNTYHCFGCGKSGDVIEFIQLKEKCTKHEAILKAQDFVGALPDINNPGTKPAPGPAGPVPPQGPAKELPRLAVLSKIAQDTRASYKRTQQARQYLTGRKLDPDKLETGYIGRELGKAWNSALQQSGLKLGLLKQNAQGTFAPRFTHCILFFTKNEKGQIAGLYGRSILAPSQAETGKHFYLSGHHQGIYPSYPKPGTKKLILTECIIDCATLQQTESITKDYGLIALFGVNGLTSEIEQAITDLKELNEAILFFDGDKAGKEAINKTGKRINALKPDI